MNFNVCIVGCGDRGQTHAKAWEAHPSAHVVAVCDIDATRAQLIADDTGAAVYTDWREAISHADVNVLSQCVPSYLHADVACFAADRGCHVFAEKPLALTLDQGERILDAVKASGIVFMPCFQSRDMWAFTKYREAFQSGELGTPVTLRTSSMSEVRPKLAMHRTSMNGGPVIDLACHTIDLLRWITGEEPVRVFAAGNVFGRGKTHLDGIEDLAIDEACIEVGYSGGHQLQMYVNWGMPEGFSNVGDNMILGPDRLIRPGKPGIEVHSGGSVETILPPEGARSAGVNVRIAQLVRAIEEKTTLDITCEDAMIALRVSYAALRSIESGETEKL